MALVKLGSIAQRLLPAGALALATGLMIQHPRSPNNEPGTTPVATQRLSQPGPAPEKKEGDPPRIDFEAELEGALRRFESAWKDFIEGRIAVGPLLQSADALSQAERSHRKGSLQELSERHLGRLEQIEAQARKNRELEAGTQLEVETAQRVVEKARDDVKLAREFKQPRIPDLVEAARQRFYFQRASYEEGRITLDRFLAACRSLMEAERLAAETDGARIMAVKKYVHILNEIEARERAELILGKGTPADVAEAIQSRVEAEVLLLNSNVSKPRAGIEALERRLSEVERKLDGLLKQQAERQH
jgi:hypothetical protein